jgi:P22_AR N-terminal domain
MQKPSVEVQKLDIMGDQVTTWRDNRTKKVYVECRGRCDFLGVDWSGQRKKLAESAFYSRHLNRGVISTDQGDREMIGLELKYLRMWLTSINPQRVRPEVRETLLAYQEKCAEILDKHWNNRSRTVSDMLLRPITVEISKDANAKWFDDGGKRQISFENARVTRDLLGKNPEYWKQWAKAREWPAKKRSSGLEVLRHGQPEVAASISFVKEHVTQGHLYEKVLPIGKDLVPIYNKMILAGLHVAELEE